MLSKTVAIFHKAYYELVSATHSSLQRRVSVSVSWHAVDRYAIWGVYRGTHVRIVAKSWISPFYISDHHSDIFGPSEHIPRSGHLRNEISDSER